MVKIKHRSQYKRYLRAINSTKYWNKANAHLFMYLMGYSN